MNPRHILPILALALLAACSQTQPGTTSVPMGGGSGVADQGATRLSTVARKGVAGCWGYTDPSGRRYALMGTEKGILVTDLNDPTNPRVVDEIDGPTNTSTPGIYWREMRTYGTYAYISSEHTNVRPGVMILDLSNLPTSVTYVRSFTPRDGNYNAHTVDIDPATGLLYLQRYTNLAAPGVTALHDEEHPGSAGNGSIEIWDLKGDPANPTYLTTFNQNRSVHDMTARGGKCYVAEGFNSSYSIWDVSDPAHPSLQLRWSVTSGHFAHNIWPNADGTLVATTEEVPEGLPMRLWSINGTHPPVARGSYKVGDATPHNVIIEGNRAYLSHYSQGVAVLDISNPDAPALKVVHDTSTYTGADYRGCWGVYKFPGQDLMLGSDIEAGLFVVRITAP